MIPVHVCEGGEYACPHYHVHPLTECERRFHDPFVTVRLDAHLLTSIQAALTAGTEAERVLENIYYRSTTMAQPLTCDLCGEEAAILLQQNLTDGSSVTVGPACLHLFFGGALLGVIGSDGHAGPPTKCQACRRSHERMTTPVAPISIPADDQGDHTGEPAGPVTGTESG